MSKNVQPRRVIAVLCAAQQLRLEKHFEGGSDLRQLVAEERGQLLAGEKRARVTSEEDQQIQIGSMAQHSQLIEHTPSVFVFHR